MHGGRETDFSRMAAELREDAERAAAAAAAANPDRSKELRRKARDLARAAERIGEDANARASYVIIDPEES
jgi:hypothetical protein